MHRALDKRKTIKQEGHHSWCPYKENERADTICPYKENKRAYTICPYKNTQINIRCRGVLHTPYDSH